MAIYLGWQLPAALQEILQTRPLKTNVKVALVIVFYAEDHSGNAPSSYEIAKALGISKTNAQRCINELILMGAFDRVDGKLIRKKPLVQLFIRNNLYNGANAQMFNRLSLL